MALNHPFTTGDSKCIIIAEHEIINGNFFGGGWMIIMFLLYGDAGADEGSGSPFLVGYFARVFEPEIALGEAVLERGE